MSKTFFKSKILFSAILSSIAAQNIYAHGFMEKYTYEGETSPGARNYFCGYITKPWDDVNKSIVYSECIPILYRNNNNYFATSGNGVEEIYNYMSILDKSSGATTRESKGKVLRDNLPENVCSFDTEYGGGFKPPMPNNLKPDEWYPHSPWDANFVEWPVNQMKTGRNLFTWNIKSGPHFSDTENFVFLITKQTGNFDPHKRLLWSDFEPLCYEDYNDAGKPTSPTGNVVADKATSRFYVWCNVPNKYSGRHVIYAEWGRNTQSGAQERFHACIDVNFNTDNDNGGELPPPPPPSNVEAVIKPLPSDNIHGTSTIQLDGSSSSGDKLKYNWTTNNKSSGFYVITDAKAAVTTLQMADPDKIRNVDITLTVTDKNKNQSVAKVTIKHSPEHLSQWSDLGSLTPIPQTLNIDDKISVRTVQKDGKDVYYPTTPLIITEANKAAEIWPNELAKAVNKTANTPIQVGVMNNKGVISPKADATANKIYSNSPNIQSGFLQVERKQEEVNQNCKVVFRDKNAWWASIDVFTGLKSFDLDFSKTGIDLTKINFDPGVFSAKVMSPTIIRVTNKPDWVNDGTGGYMGMGSSQGYPELANISVMPTCKEVK